MEIRQATLEDESSVVALYLGLVNEVKDRFDQEAPSYEVGSKLIKQGIENEDPIFVACDEDKIVGAIAWISTSMEKRLFSLFVYVVPEHRRNGIASDLIQRARNYSCDNDYLSVFDTVSLSNKAGMAMMKSLDIKPVAYAYTYAP